MKNSIHTTDQKGVFLTTVVKTHLFDPRYVTYYFSYFENYFFSVELFRPILDQTNTHDTNISQMIF